jgi:non-heme chloroperoxidase
MFAQTFLGTWQGTVHAGDSDVRLVLEIVQPSGAFAPIAHLYSPDQSPEGKHVDTLSFADDHLHFTLAVFHLAYDATLSADGQTLNGTLTQGTSSSLNLTRAIGPALWIDPRLHGTSSFVVVEPGVRLEVVDWGGSGRTLVLLSGLGNTAHIFDQFAQKLIPHFHVVGITRRGFGDSSVPPTANPDNYAADRLGNDVLAVLAASHFVKPVLIGHSIAGEELSSVSTRHPEAVSALVYLDAAFPYAYYDPAVGDFSIDFLDLQRKIAALLPGGGDTNPASTMAAVEALLPTIKHDLADRREMLSFMESPHPDVPTGTKPILSPSDAITLGEQKYTHIASPALALFAIPHDMNTMMPKDSKALPAAEAWDKRRMSAIADSFEHGVPGAEVVRISHASHYVFLSNEAEVLRSINSFLAAHP